MQSVVFDGKSETVLVFENQYFMEQLALSNKENGVDEELINIQKTHQIATFETFQTENENARTENDDDEYQIESEFLARLMNPDGVLQIGKWLFRIDKPNELVYVLPVEHKQLYRKLIKANPNHPKITVFSTDDEVLTLLKEGVTGKPSGRTEGFICDEPKAGNRGRVDTKENTSGKRRIRVEHGYGKYGVYFEAHAHMRLQEKKWWGWARAFGEIEMDIRAQYLERCGGTGTISAGNSMRGSNTRRLKHTIYSSTKQLEGFTISSSFWFIENNETFLIKLPTISSNM